MQQMQETVRPAAIEPPIRIEPSPSHPGHVDWAWVAVGAALVAFWAVVLWVIATAVSIG